MSRQKNRKPRPTAMTPEQVQRVQQLRRCNASGAQVRRTTRGAEKKAAIRSGW